MTLSLVVLDAGARYGLHPTWQSMESIATFRLFEADEAEAARLKKKYESKENISVSHCALFSTETKLEFMVRRHRALTSSYAANSSLLDRENYRTDEHQNIDSYWVQTRCVDTLFDKQDVHFFKLDVEGAELEILKGGKETISRSVLGVRAEVIFSPILTNAPLFGEVNDYMLDAGFELLNLDYDGKGSARSYFTLSDRFGKLMSTDAVWIVPTERALSGRYGNPLEAAIRLSLFCMLNGATDVALELLLKVSDKQALVQYRGDPIFEELHRQVALLFKELAYVPTFEFSVASEAYEKIFGKKFPQLNEFYESSIV